MIACANEIWTPGIGDPSMVGWATVFVYALASLLAVGKFSLSISVSSPIRLRVFWILISVILIFLTVNKQLDLQSAMRIAGKCMAIEYGWYGQRTILQSQVMVGIAFVILVGITYIIKQLRGYRLGHCVLLFGLALLACFVLLRATSIHGIDAFLGQRFWGLKANWIVEIGALCIVIIGILTSWPKLRKR